MASKITDKRIGAFVAAAEAGDVEAIRRELDAGMPPGSRTEEGFFALYLAAERGHVPVVRALLDAGADPNQVAFINGQFSKLPTALHNAVDMVLPEVVDLLLDAGANPRTVDNESATSAHRMLRLSGKYLALPGGADMLERLLDKMLDKGVPVNQPQSTGHVLLHLAIVNDAPHQLQCKLIAHGAELRASDGMKLLHAAVFHNRIEAVRLLVEHGVDINCVDKDGKSVLWKSESLFVNRWLLDSGADVNLVDIRGMTVLHDRLADVISPDEVPPLVEMLISAGADVHVKPFKSSQTAWDRIESEQYSGIAAIVRARDARSAIRKVASRYSGLGKN